MLVIAWCRGDAQSVGWSRPVGGGLLFMNPMTYRIESYREAVFTWPRESLWPPLGNPVMGLFDMAVEVLYAGMWR